MTNQFPFTCLDCGMNLFLEWFTVHDHIWVEMGLGPRDGRLCIGCVESRIGRRLRASDFPSTDNNRPHERLSDRFLDRLGWQLGFKDDNGSDIPREVAQPWIVDYDNPPR